jgi:hypothetical protein
MTKQTDALVLEIKTALQQYLIEGSDERQADLACASFNLFEQVVKQTNIEPDNYLAEMDDALRPVFEQFKISEYSDKALQIFLQNVQRVDNTKAILAFQAINLLYSKYLSPSILRENRRFLEYEHIQEKLLSIDLAIKRLNGSANTDSLAALQARLKQAIIPHLAMSPEQFATNYPELQTSMVSICREVLQELETTPNHITLITVLRDLIVAIQLLAEQLHIISPKPRDRNRIFGKSRVHHEESITRQLIDLVESLNESVATTTRLQIVRPFLHVDVR